MLDLYEGILEEFCERQRLSDRVSDYEEPGCFHFTMPCAAKAEWQRQYDATPERRAARKAWRAANREKRNAIDRARRARQRAAAWRAANPERKRDQNRRYYLTRKARVA